MAKRIPFYYLAVNHTPRLGYMGVLAFWNKEERDAQYNLWLNKEKPPPFVQKIPKRDVIKFAKMGYHPQNYPKRAAGEFWGLLMETGDERCCQVGVTSESNGGERLH